MSPSPRRVRFALDTPAVDAMAEALLKEPSSEPIGTLETISIAHIAFDPNQPRTLHVSRTNPADIAADDPEGDIKRAELEDLQELAGSIREQGIIEAIGVYRHGPNYRLIWGERRVLASILAGRETVLARLFPERPRNVRAQQLIENVQRKGLTLGERIRGVRHLIEEAGKNGTPMQSAADLAKAVGWGQAAAYAYWGIVHGPDDVAAAVDAGTLNDLKQAYAIASKDSAEERASAIEAAAGGERISAPSSEQAPQAQRTAVVAVAKRGRPMTAIPLGKTKSPHVARFICERLLDTQDFAVYEGADWNDMKTASDILRQVLKRIEQQITKGN